MNWLKRMFDGKEKPEASEEMAAATEELADGFDEVQARIKLLRKNG